VKNKKIRVAQIAPLWIPVPPRTYGGIELMLHFLTEALVQRGHQITLFASGDSQTAAALISSTEKAILRQKGLRSPHAFIYMLLKEIHNRRHSFDLIHNHADFFMFPLLFTDKNAPPILTTLHRPLDEAEIKVIKAYPQIKLCALSQNQKKSAAENGIPVEKVIYNGINPELYQFNDEPENYFVYLGRLNAEKGIVDALEVAGKAKVKLVVAGNLIGGDEWNYFLQEVQPRLNEENIQFIGQVDFNEKVKILSRAKALLFPIARREPFGLVMIEAMACGTPVIAYRRGSVPEIIENKKTGFIVENQEEMAEAIKNIDTIKRKNCRQSVENNFTLDQMVDKYERLYKKLIS
jgi:glycosyltransferase involved in cell wall biosynthesis